MSDEHDLLEALARLRPADSVDGPIAPGQNPEADAILARVQRECAAQSVPGAPRRRNRRLFTGLGVVGAALAGGTIAWAIARHAPADDALSVACYEAPDLQSSIRVVASDGRPAAELCEEAWATGQLGGETPDALAACVGPAGAPAVFPAASTDVCDALGLVALDPEPAANESAEISFQDSLTSRVLDLGCISGDELNTIIDEELRRVALDDDWTVTSLDPSGDLVCAAPRLDASEQTVYIEFLPDIWNRSPPSLEEP